MRDAKEQIRIDIWTPDPQQTGGVQQYSRGIIEGLDPMVNLHVVSLSSGGIISKLLFSLQAVSSWMFRRPNIIWCTHLHLARLSWLLSIFKPTVWISLHGIDCWQITDSRDIKSLQLASQLLCVSHYTMQRVAENHPETREKLQWFPNHLAHSPEIASNKQKAREQLNLPQGALILLTVSRLSSEEKYKGHREVLRAMPALSKIFPQLHYLVVGSGDDLPALKQLSRELEITNRVIFTGRLPDDELETAYSSADLFVLSGQGEGFGIVLLDALARGIPVVASSEDGSRDAVLNGELGDLASPSEAGSVTNTLKRILHSLISDQYPQTAESLRTKVLKHYGPVARNERLNELLKETR